MDMIKGKDLVSMFEVVDELFQEKKDTLTKMDSEMGDGDLGLTMSKGFAGLPGIIEEQMDETNLGGTLMKSGMKLASLIPSTMGTLMASGFMSAGKALKAKSELKPEDMVTFLDAFAEGIKNRGKTEVGDRTVYDALYLAAQYGEKAFNEGKSSFIEIFDAALEGAQQGVEDTKNMLPKFGKAAVFSDKAIGREDQGAVAGMYLIQGMRDYFAQN